MDNTVIDTKCYVVATNVRKFSMLQETALELIMQIDEPVGLYGKPLADNWVPMEVTWFYNPDERIKPQPDIAAFGSTAFAVSAATCEQLRPHIQDYVEFLPINVDGWRWYIIHVLAREDVFNEQESRRFMRLDGTPSRMFEKLVLDGHRAKNGVLFRVTGLGLGIFTTDIPNSFKQVVKKLKLTGLSFQDIE
ncbi:hypothetical protein [Rheinheimera hassiensis]|uniref:hypothetical protein n=1 Tax=Rheinheimera hassiensis TaxID=1193627 RepID=UPI001F057DAF|nr:hypothetical protein [Rheinheimera hassiensis]